MASSASADAVAIMVAMAAAESLRVGFISASWVRERDRTVRVAKGAGRDTRTGAHPARRPSRGCGYGRALALQLAQPEAVDLSGGRLRPLVQEFDDSST